MKRYCGSLQDPSPVLVYKYSSVGSQMTASILYVFNCSFPGVDFPSGKIHFTFVTHSAFGLFVTDYSLTRRACCHSPNVM